MTNIYDLLWILPILLFEAFFSGSEIALFSVDRIKLKIKEKNGSRGARIALNLISQNHRIFSVTLLMTSLSIVSISTLAVLVLHRLEVHNEEFIAVLLTSPLIVFFGELFPKSIFRKNADSLAPIVGPILYVVYFIFYPITFFLAFYNRRINRIFQPLAHLFGMKRSSRDDLRTLLSESSPEKLSMSFSQASMLKRILNFKESSAKNALIPLVRVDAIANDALIGEALDAFYKNGHSRIPVYSDRVDNITGLLQVTDLLTAVRNDQKISPYVRPILYVPETQGLVEILGELQEKEMDMMVVVDEYGGAKGIITSEDIIEEIVGDIQDEYDTEKPAYRPITENRWMVEARMEISKLNETVPIELPHGDYETLGGFLLKQFKRLPESGDELFFDTPQGSFRFYIQHASRRRIEKVLIERLSQT